MEKDSSELVSDSSECLLYVKAFFTCPFLLKGDLNKPPFFPTSCISLSDSFNFERRSSVLLEVVDNFDTLDLLLLYPGRIC